MKTLLTDEQAIIQAIRDGAGGDFCDLAEAVRQRYGNRVSSQQVEDVYRQYKDNASLAAQTGGVSASSSGYTQSIPTATLPQGTQPPLKFGRMDVVVETEVPLATQAPVSKDDRGARAEQVDGRREYTLEFVQKMGGFEAARAAIGELEDSLRRLLKQ